MAVESLQKMGMKNNTFCKRGKAFENNLQESNLS